MKFAQLTDFSYGLRGIAKLGAEGVQIKDVARFRKEAVDGLAEAAIFGASAEVRDAARWIIWEAAHELGAYPCSIQGLYEARGKGEYKGVTVPAVNLRTLTYDTARAMFRAAKSMNAGPMLFEIAKSEMGYTAQPPAEFASAVLAAALREGWNLPVCIQGDHFQVNVKKYNEDAAKEVGGVKSLIVEALAAGFYNIDLDTSTLVDLDEKKTVKEQQHLNYDIAAQLTAHIRANEPKGIVTSIGGEIGEVGKQNSTVEELVAYVDGYRETLEKLAPGNKGISKLSIQTGTSHGGVPLADGTVAQVALDFDCLRTLGEKGRDAYKISGTVQHGASTLPDAAFHRFCEAECVEVHLATGFQNMIFDHPSMAKELKERMYAWLHVNAAKERKPGETEEQFLYKSRKKVLGPFKPELWFMCPVAKAEIMGALEVKFAFLFEQLGLRDSRALAEKYITKARVKHAVPNALAQLLADPALYGNAFGVEEDIPGAD